MGSVSEGIPNLTEIGIGSEEDERIRNGKRFQQILQRSKP